jgi:hypothetical protein
MMTDLLRSADADWLGTHPARCAARQFRLRQKHRVQGRYEQRLQGLQRDHLGQSYFYYLNVSIEETFRRHALRPQASEFTTDAMRDWYRPQDLLGSVQERVVPQTSTLQQTMGLILSDTQLLGPGTMREWTG